jgi:hypothetical protein
MAITPRPDEVEGNRLGEKYEKANLHYQWAINELTRQRETAHGEDFDKLARYVREAEAEKTEARRALERFKSEHPKES